MQAIKYDDGLQQFTDGYAQGVPGGMDSSVAPDLIGREYASLGVNLTFRGGRPRTRPRNKEIVFQSGRWKNTLLTGLFLGGATYYETPIGTSKLVGVYDGWVLEIDPTNGLITCLNPEDKNNGLLRHYLLQAEGYLIIQNGSDLPLIYNIAEKTIRRAKTEGNNPYLQVLSITQIDGLATVTVAGGHPYKIGDKIEIANAAPAGYNGYYFVTDVFYNSFTIDVNTQLESPARVERLVYPIIGHTIITKFEDELPRGLLMAYGQGRLCVSSPDRTKLFVGNIIFGDGTEENILRFSEDEYLAEGGYFKLPANQGRITAVSFIPLQDVNTGQGVLFAFGEYGTSSLDISTPRSSWKDNQIQKVVFISEGATSQNSCVGFNGDLMYRSQQGLRSYRNARADLDNFGQTPMSAEVRRILDEDDTSRLTFISAINFDNRILMTCTPQFEARTIRVVNVIVSGELTTIYLESPSGLEDGDKVDITGIGIDGEYTVVEAVTDDSFTVASEAGVSSGEPNNGLASGAGVGTQIYHAGAVVLDFTSLSGARGKEQPAWEGVWSGLKYQQLVVGWFAESPRAYAFTFDGSTRNSIWEITKEYGPDVNFREHEARIECVLESRGFDFDKPFNMKRITRQDQWWEQLDGMVSFKVEYNSDSSCWQRWIDSEVYMDEEFVYDYQRCATVSNPIVPETNINVIGLNQNLPQSRPQISIGIPPNVCDEVTRGPTFNGFEFQIRLSWKGNIILSKLLLYADPLVENIRATCPMGPYTGAKT